MVQQTAEQMQTLYAQYNSTFAQACLVHATTHNHFIEILHAGKIGKTAQATRVGNLEKEMGFGHVVWLSPGFMYNAFLHDKNDYAVIFSPDVDTDLCVYKRQVIREAYAMILRELKRLVPEELEKLKARSLDHRRLIDDFFVKRHFCAWQIREDIYSAYRKSKARTTIARKLEDLERQARSRTPQQTVIYRYKHPSTISGGEIIAKAHLPLDTSHLLGFFVREQTEETLSEIQSFLEKAKRVQRIAIFDGKRIRTLRKTAT